MVYAHIVHNILQLADGVTCICTDHLYVGASICICELRSIQADGAELVLIVQHCTPCFTVRYPVHSNNSLSIDIHGSYP